MARPFWSGPAWVGPDGLQWPCLCIWGPSRGGWDDLGVWALCPHGLIFQEAEMETVPAAGAPQASACIPFAVVPLAKASLMATPSFRGW